MALHKPHIAEYLNIKLVESILDKGTPLPGREYDEKFHILQAPSLFIPDLRYYRQKAEMRGVSIAVAYMDIDSFKSFNTEHGESTIDRYLLPKFMEVLEGHVFAIGHAYRYGGDEYVVLLPNASRESATALFEGFQAKLARTEYRGITRRPTVSIGFCIVDSDCYLTEGELEERANRAKKHAKDNGKNCIASFNGTRFHDDELVVVSGGKASGSPGS